MQDTYTQYFGSTFKIPVGNYWAKRYKVEAEIEITPCLEDFEIWPISINAGFAYNPEEGFNNAEIVDIDYENYTCTVRTYVYKLYYCPSGAFFRWFPCVPSDVILEITVSKDINPTDSDNNDLMNNTLWHNYPNPFNPTTSIFYNLTGKISNPLIEIYNLKGQIVRNYQLEEKPGEKSIVWNGKDSNNNIVSSGVYFYTLKNNGQVLETRKMMLLK